jgi:hypothetical protein
MSIHRLCYRVAQRHFNIRFRVIFREPFNATELRVNSARESIVLAVANL